ncbi:hypothetical protein DFJ74DRAFT_756739 [Hyaloraphidium curvatum]|nr:hypothetical protein DFJ74DRAFT_756739 [Hyaloraphidium curvatum]
MGVAGLTAFVERATRHVDLIAEGRRLAALRKAGGGAASSNEIVVDGNGLFRRLYSPHIDWVRGGQFERLAAEVRTFVERFTRAGWALTVVFDGQIEATKRKVWVSRRTVEARRAEQIMDYLAAQEMLPPESQQMPPKKLWFLPVSTTRAIPNAFRDAGCEVHFSLGEADREIAHRAIEKGAYAVLADDSDYLAFDIPRVLSLRNLRGMRTTLIDREAKAKIFPGLLPEYWPLLATLSGNDYGRRVGFLDNFGPGDAAAPGDDYFARASGFILEHVQGKGIGPHDANAIANAIAAYARTLPRDFRRTAPQPAKLAERLRASLRQYSFDGIRDGVDTHLVPAALRAPGVWERVVAMHTEGVLDYECLSVLAKRLVNFGVVVEQKPTAPGALPGTWELTKELFRRVYGVLLADPGAEDKPKVHPAAATPPTPHSLPDILPTAKPSFSPIPPLSGVVPSSAANPSPPSSPAPPPGLSPRFPPSPPRSSPSPFPNPAPWLGDPAVVAAVPSKPSTASAFGSGAWAPAQPADAFPAPPEDDEVDENGFRDSVARIAGLIGEDEDSGEPAVAAEEPDADLEEVEDDLEEEARKLLAESGDEEGDDDDLSTIADAEELLEQGKVAEWVMSVGKHFTEPEKASATLEINGQSLPSLVSLLTAQQHQRLRAFYLCAGAPSDFHLNYGTPPVLTAVCLALRHLVSNPNFAARVKPLEAQALLAQAVNQAMRSPSYRGRPAAAANPWDVPLSPRTVHLGNLFLRTMLALSMLNDACCRPLGDSVSRAWKYFDGVMWQRRLNQARQAADAGGSGTDSLLDRQPEMVVFRMCWQQVVRGTVWQGLVAPEQRGQPRAR